MYGVSVDSRGLQRYSALTGADTLWSIPQTTVPTPPSETGWVSLVDGPLSKKLIPSGTLEEGVRLHAEGFGSLYHGDVDGFLCQAIIAPALPYPSASAVYADMLGGRAIGKSSPWYYRFSIDLVFMSSTSAKVSSEFTWQRYYSVSSTDGTISRESRISDSLNGTVNPSVDNYFDIAAVINTADAWYPTYSAAWIQKP